MLRALCYVNCSTAYFSQPFFPLVYLISLTELTAMEIAFCSFAASPLPFYLLPGQRTICSLPRGTHVLFAGVKVEFFSAFPSVGQ